VKQAARAAREKKVVPFCEILCRDPSAKVLAIRRKSRNRLLEPEKVAPQAAGLVIVVKRRLHPGQERPGQQALDRFFREVNATQVSDLRPSIVDAYFGNRIRNGASPRSASIGLAVLKTLLNWGVALRLINDSPLVSLKPYKGDPKKRRRAMEVKEAEKLLTASKEPWRSIWLALLTTGARISELLSLKWADVNLQRSEITFRPENVKTRKQRIVPIHARLLEVLLTKQAGAEPGDYVFQTQKKTPYSRRNVLRAFYSALKRVKLSLDGSLDLHALRGTCATWLLRERIPVNAVQLLLGHASPQTTLNCYAKMTGEDIKSAVQSLPLFKPKAPTSQTDEGEAAVV
jgi:integrase